MIASLRRIRAVALREFFASAASPAAWIFLVIFLILIAFCTFMMSGLFSDGQADLGPFFTWMPWLFLLIVPALGMPFWADERRSGTFELTLSFPATIWELVIGKFSAGLLLLLAALLLTVSTPLTALYLGRPDPGSILTGYLGSFLIGSVFLAVSSFCSALSKSQTASFLLSLLVCAFLMFIGWPQMTETAVQYLPQWLIETIAFCGILPHFQAFQRGIIDSGEVLYSLTCTLFFLTLAKLALEFAAAGVGNLFAPGAFTEPFTRKSVGRLFVGALTALFLFFCVNMTASTFPVRWDATGDHAYSLSPEAKRLAENLEFPVNIRLYVTSSGVAMPTPLKKYAERIDWLLGEFVTASRGKITLTRLDPEPDSSDEEVAVLEGIKPLPLNTGDRVFLGLSVAYADRCIPIPFLSPQNENMLEYEIARALNNVTRKTKAVVGVMSAFPVLGTLQQENQFTRQEDSSRVSAPERAWYSLSELAGDMNLMWVSLDVPRIPEEVQTLLVIHPAGISERGQYAIDQFLLRGGRLALFLDPNSLYADRKAQKDLKYLEKLSSDLPLLLKAWGVSFNKDLMISDMTFAYRRTLPDRMVTNPLILNITREGVSADQPVSASLNALSMYYAASFEIFQKQESLRCEPLVVSTPNSQVVSALLRKPELAIRSFQPSGTKHPLALRISGSFPSAFPQGAPDASAVRKDMPHLNRSVKNSEVFVFGDADMLFNDACIRVAHDALGQTTVIRQNDNLTLFQNVMEQLNGSENLSSIRGRVPMTRPLTRINEIKAKAELAYKERIAVLERQLLDAQNQMRRIQNAVTAGGGKVNLTPEQEQQIRDYTKRSMEFKRELKNLRAGLRADLNRLDNSVRIFNLVFVPLLVILAGMVWSFLRLAKWRRRK